MVRNSLREEIKKMSAAERILLAQDLWDSVADDPDAWELTPAQEREIDRRLKALERRAKSGKRAGSTWAQVKRRVRKSA